MTEDIKKTPKPEIETVEVDKSKFEQFVEDYKSLTEQIKEQKDAIERLTYAADKNRLGSYDERTKKNIVPECQVRTLIDIVADGTETLIIKGWRMVEDTVEEQASGVFYVKQVVELVLEDKEGKISKREMPLRAFEKKFKYIKGDIIAETKDAETGSEIVDVRLEDGRKIKLDKIFIN